MNLSRKMILAAAVACALAPDVQAETAVTVYSSARPGTLDPRVFASGGGGIAIPGYEEQVGQPTPRHAHPHSHGHDHPHNGGVAVHEHTGGGEHIG